MLTNYRVVYSVVSHGQLSLIRNLLRDIRPVLDSNSELVLVLNISEDESVLAEFSDMPITLIRNSFPKGFGANHNQAFDKRPSDYFVIVNPDIRLPQFNIAGLVNILSAGDVGAVAPVVLSPTGEIEDSIRRFPNMFRLLKRVVLRRRSPDYSWGASAVDVDWSAGMFVVFSSAVYRSVCGFDDRFFMYMEDADICRRIKKIGFRVVLDPSTSVVHDAQRASRRSIRHLKWHLSSAFRFLFLTTKRS